MTDLPLNFRQVPAKVPAWIVPNGAGRNANTSQDLQNFSGRTRSLEGQMKALLRAAALGAALWLACVTPMQAQNAPRVYENGSVWQISYIETKPGKFDDYMANLNGAWKQSNELRKKAGDVLSYKVLAVNSPGDGKPDLILMVEYKNMAVFDRSQAEVEKQTAELFGLVARGRLDREAQRTQRGSLLTRELVFSK